MRRIRTTTVRPQQDPNEATLSSLECERLAAFASRNAASLKLRRSGLTPDQIRNLEILRWEVQSSRVARG